MISYVHSYTKTKQSSKAFTITDKLKVACVCFTIGIHYLQKKMLSQFLQMQYITTTITIMPIIPPAAPPNISPKKEPSLSSSSSS